MTPPRVSAHRAAPLPSGAAGTSDTITSGAGYSTIACVKLLMCPSCATLFSANQVSFVFASAITDGAAEAVGIGYSSTVWSVFDIEPMEFVPGSVNQIRPEAESGETHAADAGVGRGKRGLRDRSGRRDDADRIGVLGEHEVRPAPDQREADVNDVARFLPAGQRVFKQRPVRRERSDLVGGRLREPDVAIVEPLHEVGIAEVARELMNQAEPRCDRDRSALPDDRVAEVDRGPNGVRAARAAVPVVGQGDGVAWARERIGRVSAVHREIEVLGFAGLTVGGLYAKRDRLGVRIGARAVSY